MTIEKILNQLKHEEAVHRIMAATISDSDIISGHLDAAEALGAARSMIMSFASIEVGTNDA